VQKKEHLVVYCTLALAGQLLSSLNAEVASQNCLLELMTSTRSLGMESRGHVHNHLESFRVRQKNKYRLSGQIVRFEMTYFR